MKVLPQQISPEEHPNPLSLHIINTFHFQKEILEENFAHFILLVVHFKEMLCPNNTIIQLNP